MRIYCRDCGSKALITRVVKEALEYTKLYCICLDPTCGHGFVSELRLSHTLKPSKIKPADSAMIERIFKLSDDQQTQLLQQLDMLA